MCNRCITILVLLMMCATVRAVNIEVGSPGRNGQVNEKSYYNGLYKQSLTKTDSIREYTLPDPLLFEDGRPVETAAQWYTQRRSEILEIFDREVYGRAPGRIPGTEYSIVEEGLAFGGKAIRRQVKIDFHKNGQYIMVLMYLPAEATDAVPVFLGINFKGNHSISHDTQIIKGRHTKAERGASVSRWPVETIIASGYGVITFHAADVDPDWDDWRNGVTSFIYKEGQKERGDDEWGNISEWAWGLSRVMDYIETDRSVDATKVAVFGHSRMGKTALLAGARDERFAIVISNDSGSCGAALSRRWYGETIEAGANLFPYWYCNNFFKYLDDVDSLPIDQHELLALVAPRALYVASAEGDAWADPVGERLAWQEARKVYDFLGVDRSRMGYHIREGKHDINIVDWGYYLDFANSIFK